MKSTILLWVPGVTRIQLSRSGLSDGDGLCRYTFRVFQYSMRNPCSRRKWKDLMLYITLFHEQQSSVNLASCRVFSYILIASFRLSTLWSHSLPPSLKSFYTWNLLPHPCSGPPLWTHYSTKYDHLCNLANKPGILDCTFQQHLLSMFVSLFYGRSKTAIVMMVFFFFLNKNLETLC